MNYDQLFKDLLQRFFREFMWLFFPDIARRLDFGSVTFLDKELFTDLQKGKQREADMVARVKTLDGKPEIILTHFEFEGKRRGGFNGRMFEYFQLLRPKHGIPILPIAIFFSPGAGGIVVECYVEELFGLEVCRFQYHAVGLPDLLADEYLNLENPLGPALSGFMKPGRLTKVVRKFQSLRRMALSGLDDAGKSMLVNLIEVSTPLSPIEESEFQTLTENPEQPEVKEMLNVYEERALKRGIEQGIEEGKKMLNVYEERALKRGIEQGIEEGKKMLNVYEERALKRGIEQGIAKGIEQGIAEGIALGKLRGKRELICQQVRMKFSDAPADLEDRLQKVTDSEELDALQIRVVTAQSLAELGIPDD